MRESEVSFILLKTKCRANIKSWMSKTIKLKSTNSSYTVFLSCTQLWGKTSSFFLFLPKFQQVFDSLAFQCFFKFLNARLKKLLGMQNTTYRKHDVCSNNTPEIQTDPLGISTKSTNNRSFTYIVALC